MSSSKNRWVLPGAVLLASVALVAVGSSQVQKEHDPGYKHDAKAAKDFALTRPGASGPVGSPTYLGELVSGKRASGLPPVPVTTPDLPKLEHKVVDGFKEFHLHVQPVKRELLPRVFMKLWGYHR